MNRGSIVISILLFLLTDAQVSLGQPTAKVFSQNNSPDAAQQTIPGFCGAIEGHVLDIKREPAQHASVTFYQNDKIVGRVETDLDGKYVTSELKAGKYDLEFAFAKHDTIFMSSILVKEDSVTTLNVHMDLPYGRVPIRRKVTYKSDIVSTPYNGKPVKATSSFHKKQVSDRCE